MVLKRPSLVVAYVIYLNNPAPIPTYNPLIPSFAAISFNTVTGLVDASFINPFPFSSLIAYILTFVISNGWMQQVAMQPDNPPTTNGFIFFQTPESLMLRYYILNL